MTPYLLKEAFLAKTHNLKHLTRHTNAVGIYHCSLLCSHSQISVRADGRTDGRTDKLTLRRMRQGLIIVFLVIACNKTMQIIYEKGVLYIRDSLYRDSTQIIVFL